MIVMIKMKKRFSWPLNRFEGTETICSRVSAYQGDQMSLWKSRPKCSPTHFLSKLMRNFHRGKSSTKVYIYFCHFQKTAQRKQLPNGRKLGQTGHPATNVCTSLLPEYFSRLHRDYNNFRKTVFSKFERKVLIVQLPSRHEAHVKKMQNSIFFRIRKKNSRVESRHSRGRKKRHLWANVSLFEKIRFFCKIDLLKGIEFVALKCQV
jgi:hypothetical protein